MSTSVIAALIWMVATNLRGMFPSSDNHWRFAYLMIVLGLPIVIWIYFDHGLLLAGVFLLGGMWILRWPVIYLGRWLRKVIGQ